MLLSVASIISRFEKLISKKKEQNIIELKYINKLLEVSLLIKSIYAYFKQEIIFVVYTQMSFFLIHIFVFCKVYSPFEDQGVLTDLDKTGLGMQKY